MLSGHEQRVLDELERCLAAGSPEPGWRRSGSGWSAGRMRRRLGVGLLAVLGCAGVFLLFSGVAVAALALATATAIVWLFGRLCSRHVHGVSTPASPLLEADIPPGATHRRLGASVRNYLRWLAEAE